MAKHKRSNRGPHDYPRTARLNELVREIVADELELPRHRRQQLPDLAAGEVAQAVRRHYRLSNAAARAAMRSYDVSG